MEFDPIDIIRRFGDEFCRTKYQYSRAKVRRKDRFRLRFQFRLIFCGYLPRHHPCHIYLPKIGE